MTIDTPEGGRVSMVVNMLTIDVEDYFHVSVFENVIPRNQWDELESRVSANTERLLAIFDRAGVRATFFVLGWVAERYPSLVRRIAACGHEIASHGYGHRLVYNQTPRRSATTCGARSARSKTRPGACSATGRRAIRSRRSRSGRSTC